MTATTQQVNDKPILFLGVFCLFHLLDYAKRNLNLNAYTIQAYNPFNPNCDLQVIKFE
ncbi:hypothetical protein NMY3_02968 [Candidatus Nitrosocosmicus oleophilus]|uniref:Uncharacterized protein n=1 Tax=Candidatus Nitrosocosmicus oleophilus TaxID=1353260 RepID=A0A654M108_9ARCH|nr:hypothetical protein NMY3_02968 [Candidatus Nitrosocosmicus oleophilus]